MSWHRIVGGLGLVMALVAVAGCKPEDYRLAFSHNLHAKENAIACTDCHGSAKDGHFVRPSHAACTSCHGEWVDTKTVSAETCGKCHKEKDWKPAAQPAATNVGPNRIFQHGQALSNRCADCHGLLLDPKLKNVPEMRRAARVQMRNQAHRWGMACATCHADLNAQTPPENHSQNWARRHGALAEQGDSACAVCHQEQTCRDCHQVTQPQSHNELWRLKTHGVQAAWDRNRCQTCHAQDSCTSCHESIRPQSHTASWARKHCVSCHEGQAQQQNCATCHSGAAGSLQQIHAGGGWPPVHNRFLGHNVDCFDCHDAASMTRPR